MSLYEFVGKKIQVKINNGFKQKNCLLKYLLYTLIVSRDETLLITPFAVFSMPRLGFISSKCIA